jgi:ribosomal protein S18 acetylase RimI-like enzyme
MIVGPEHIRNPRSDEAQEILNLIQACFPDNYLIYSVYQTGKSLKHLQNLIDQQDNGNLKEFFRIYTAKDEILGFYTARLFEDSLFLSYIGTRRGFEKNRIGSLLLDDFHFTGKRLGRTFFGLDVYTTNDSAYNWYKKNGYLEVHHSYNHCFVSLSSAPHKDKFLQNKYQDLLMEKLREESMYGFSKIQIDRNDSHFEIMMIGGKTLRFQNLINISEDDVLKLTADSELNNRQFFLFTGRQAYQGKNSPLFSEKVVRMAKHLIS